MTATHIPEITTIAVLGEQNIQAKTPELIYFIGHFEKPIVATLPNVPIEGTFYAINLINGNEFISRKLNLSNFGPEYNNAFRESLGGRDFMYALILTPQGPSLIPMYAQGQELMGASFFFKNETEALLDLAGTLLEEEEEKNIVLN